MRRLMSVAAVALALVVAACNPVTIPNPFGGPSLVLTGNYQNDLPSIQAYAASIKAGVKKSDAEIQGWLNELCPFVTQAQVQLTDPATMDFIYKGASVVNGTQSGANKQISSVQSGLTIASKACAVGTATNLAQAFVAGVDAVVTIQSLIKTGSAN